MKKLLLVLGLGGISFALYNYFSKQLALALDWDFKASNFMPHKVYDDRFEATFDLEILNKSSFATTINSYDINILYKGKVVGSTKSNTAFEVLGDSWFTVPVLGNIYYNQVIATASSIAPLILDEKPLNVDINGKVNVTFQGINRVLVLTKKDVEVTENISKSLGLNKPIDKIKDWLSGLGVKI